MSRLLRGYQYDLGRQLERPDFLTRWLPKYADWGYDQLCLYLEDAFAFPSLPGVGRKHAYSPRQMERVVREAERRQIQVIPLVELLGHMSYVLKVKRWRHLSELPSGKTNPAWSGQICPLHPEALTLARKLLQDVQPYCTSGLVYVGLDEAFDIGKCPRCRREVESIGWARHFANHVSRLNDICRELKLRLGMAGDMLYYFRAAIGFLPKDVVVFDWFYYPFRKLPRIEYYNFADVDLSGELRRAGLTVYGAANNGPVWSELLPPYLDRLRQIVDWWRYAHQVTAEGLLITSWSPIRTTPELNSIVDAAAASLWLDPPTNDPRRMLELGLERVYGKGARRHTALLAASDRYQWTGYYRWQANSKWSALATFQSPAPLQRERAHFDTLVSRAQREQAPTAIRDCLTLRQYVTHREQFIVEGSRWIADARRGKPHSFLPAIVALERAARVALRATRALWRRSRFADDPNPNETMLDADLQRLRVLRQFSRSASQDPRRIWEASPLLGRWQLLFWARNFAPALQAVAVEVRQPDGQWQTLHSLFSMEFTAAAGRPQADFRRRHSVALDWKGAGTLKVRLAIRGLGQFEIYGLQVSDGVRSIAPSRLTLRGGVARRLKNLPRARLPGAVLGEPAPRTGFRSIDWGADQTWVDVEFGN